MFFCLPFPSAAFLDAEKLRFLFNMKALSDTAARAILIALDFLSSSQVFLKSFYRCNLP
jgi:hypothetical protein